MLRKILILLFVICLTGGQLWARPTPKNTEAFQFDAVITQKFIGPFSEQPAAGNADYQVPRRDERELGLHEVEVDEGIVDRLGDPFFLGTTWYDYQHNGSIGKMLAKDSEGGVHFTWMDGHNSRNDPRHMSYEYLIDGEVIGETPESNNEVDTGTRSGYGHLVLLPQDERALITSHVMGWDGAPNDAAITTALSTDWIPGIGAFGDSYLPAAPNTEAIWPKASIDRNNIAHVFNHEYHGENGPNWAHVYYLRGEPDFNEEPPEWDWEDPIEVGVVSVIGQMTSASRLSDRVVLAWHENRVGLDNDEWEAFGGAYQRNNDLRYIISDDGENWDFANDIQSITKIIPVDPTLLPDREKAYGDTFRPYCDIDIQFDPWNDDLYAVFATCGFWEEPDPNEDDPVEAVTGDRNVLWFWNAEEDTLTMIYNAWYLNHNYVVNRPGGWRLNADRGSIAFNPEEEGTIYVVWVHFPQIQEPIFDDDGVFTGEWEWFEFAADTSALGHSSAEIMVSISTDYGIHWREPINITNTKWLADDAPEEGLCMSENWVSAAYLADDTLHIQYIFDTEAGGAPMVNGVGEGNYTNCPVIYHRLAIADLGDPEEMEFAELPSEGFMFHNYGEIRVTIPEVVRNPGVPAPNEDVEITATVIAGDQAEIENVELVYYINGDEAGQIEMDQVNDSTYVGVISGLDAGNTVWYLVRASDTDNFSAVNPDENYFYMYTLRPDGEISIYDVQYLPVTFWGDYSPYKGYDVTVEGVVTTPASFAAEHGAYAIQDSSRGWNGVFVRGITDDLNVGDRISVTGTVMERDPEDRNNWEYCTYIQLKDPNDYEVVEEDAGVPEYVRLNAALDLTFGERAEELEGVLVKLWDFEIDDLSGINPATTDYWPITDDTGEAWVTTRGMTDAMIDNRQIRDEWRAGTSIVWVAGVLTENDGYYALAPRTDTDDEIGSWGVEDDNGMTPVAFELSPAFPNPFNAMTNINFALAEKGWAHLALYDLSGRLVMDLMEGEMNAGRYSHNVNAAALSAGVYILKLETDQNTASQKLVLMK